MTTNTETRHGPATIEELWELHQLLTEAFLEALRDHVAGKRELKASFFAVVGTFLRDNHVNTDTIRGVAGTMEALQNLAIPFPAQ